ETEAVGVVGVSKHACRPRPAVQPPLGIVELHVVVAVAADGDPATVGAHGHAVGDVETAPEREQVPADPEVAAGREQMAGQAAAVVVADKELHPALRPPDGRDRPGGSHRDEAAATYVAD